MTRARRIRVLFERLETTCLLIHASDVYPDEHVLELAPADAWWALEEWREATPELRHGTLVDVVRALDDHLPWGFRQPYDDDLDLALRDRILGAIDSGVLRMIEFKTPGKAEAAAAVRPVIKLSTARKPPPPPKETQQHWYKVRVVDEFGVPVSGAMVKLEVQGQPLRKATDGKGEARLEYPDGGRAKLELANFASLEQTLVQRWTKRLPRKPRPAGAEVLVFGIAPPEMSTVSESERVIVISDQTWIGIALKDQDDEPVAGARYVVTDAEGVEHTGELGNDGTARIEPLPRGDATIVFPEYDDERDWDAWKKAKDGKLAPHETGPVAAPAEEAAEPEEEPGSAGTDQSPSGLPPPPSAARPEGLTSEVHVRIVNAQGVAIKDLPYELTTATAALRKGKSDADGRIDEKDLPRGQYQLKVSRPPPCEANATT